MRILLLDDEAFALRLVTHQLNRIGYSDVVAFESPLAAIAFLEEDVHAVETILLDLQMPEMDGVEVVRHLVRLGFAGALVLISGEDERILQSASKLARAHGLDVRGALHKPVTPEQLRSVVGDHTVRAERPHPFRKVYTADRIRQAIRDGEIVNFYQPQVRLATGQVAGVESLARWAHPEDGLVYPDQFITTAEEHQLIGALTTAVIVNGLRQSREWRRAGIVLRMSVNVSMDNLAALDFPDIIATAVHEAGIPPETLVLEVTESRLSKDAVSAMDIVTRLRLKRVGLSIDDFGTGHSSLSQLRDMPFDELKIDQGFVHGARGDLSKLAIVRANLTLASQLGMRAVGEGIEDREDWDLMRVLGCDVGQGWFIAKAMPASDIPRWLEEWEARRPSLIGSSAQPAG